MSIPILVITWLLIAIILMIFHWNRLLLTSNAEMVFHAIIWPLELAVSVVRVIIFTAREAFRWAVVKYKEAG
jgi:hypothetical protein